MCIQLGDKDNATLGKQFWRWVSFFCRVVESGNLITFTSSKVKLPHTPTPYYATISVFFMVYAGDNPGAASNAGYLRRFS
jgi:hypothetical protein